MYYKMIQGPYNVKCVNLFSFLVCSLIRHTQYSGLEACAVRSRHGTVLKSDKAVPNLSALN